MAKSWDIQPNRKPAPQAPVSQPKLSSTPAASTPRPIQTRRVEPMVRRSALQKPVARSQSKPSPRPKPEPIKTTVVRRERIPQGKSREPLKDRRKRARRVWRNFLIVLTFLCIGAAGGSLWLPALRVGFVHAVGPDSNGLQSIAQQSMQGTDYFIIPRNSIFFFSSNDIRRKILAQYPDLSAVSISRTSLDSIAVTSIARETVFLWCGAAPDSTGTTLIDLNASTTDTTSASLTAPCYDADSQGFVFAQADQQPSDLLRVYGPVDLNSGEPLGGRIENSSALSNAIQLVKVIKGLNVAVTSLALRGDEADMYTQGGTKITYVLGNEDAAAKLAEAAFPTLSLNDGSLEYVDLRFTDKVYFKKKGETTSATSTPAH